MSKVETVRLYTPNSGEVYHEEKLIKEIKKIVSEYAEVHLNTLVRAFPKLHIKTSLRASQLGDLKLISKLNKINAKAIVSVDQDIWIECQLTKKYPSYVYGFALWFSCFITILNIWYHRE
jgi:hypothetical protein